jgi:hypothetical protein
MTFAATTWTLFERTVGGGDASVFRGDEKVEAVLGNLAVR